MTKVAIRSAEARKVLRDLNSELKSASTRTGQTLSWTAAEQELLVLIGSTIDRRADLEAMYQEAETTTARVALSAELRLLEAAAARLLKQVKTDIPAAMSNVSLKAQRAANTRWTRERARAND